MQTRRRVIGGLVVALLVCAGSAWAQHAWDAASQAVVLTADWGKVAAAARHWQQQEASAPVAAWLVGYAGLATGDYRLATEGFGRLGAPHIPPRLLAWAEGLVAQHPSNAVPQMLKGDALARSGQYPEALAALDAAVRLTPQAALLYDVRGVVKALAGKTDAAVDDFGTAIQIAPDFADAYASRGLTRGYTGHVEEALADLDRALELAPEHGLARNARAVMLASLGRLEEAKHDLRIAAQSSVGVLAVATNLSTLEWRDAQERFNGEVADRRGGVLRMEALSVYPGVNTEDNWQPHADLAVEVLRRKTGRDAIVVPFRAADGLSYAQMRDTADHAFLNAARQGKNLVLVIVPHLQLAGYLTPSGQDDQRRDLEFGKAATGAIYVGFQRAQQELAGAGQPVALTHGALSHSWGGAVQTAAMKHLYRQSGVRPFTGDLWYVVPRVKQDSIAALNQMGYDPARLHVAGIRGDAWAAPGVATAHLPTAQRGAGRNYHLHVLEPPAARGLPWDTQNTRHNLPIANPRLPLDVESYAPGSQRNHHSTDFLGLMAGSPRIPTQGPQLDQTLTPGFSPPAKADALPGPNYRLPAGALPGSPGDKWGGVMMKTDVVTDQPADLRGMLGGVAGAPPAAAAQPGLLAPFLLFCATSAR